MKILIRNLARITTESEVRDLFSPFGAITECTLVLDKTTGDSKGFAFVEMAQPREGKAAIAKLNQAKIAGNRIRVKLAE